MEAVVENKQYISIRKTKLTLREGRKSNFLGVVNTTFSKFSSLIHASNILSDT